MLKMKLIQLFAVTIFFTLSFYSVNAHEKNESGKNLLLKEKIYNADRAKVLDFSSKECDALFFEYLDKKSGLSLILTKEEYYKDMIQITTFSDRLTVLDSGQKKIAIENKKKWFAENYEDYLLSKASQKKNCIFIEY